MGKSLVIVESPAKAKTINKYLGSDYKVMASMGHIRDLPTNRLGVDTDDQFNPQYTTLPSKRKIVSELMAAAKEADEVLLAPDPDREGEAICWHLQESVIPKGKPVKRVLFNEITKSAILEAIKHPDELNMNRVDAQQARRILDRLVGYKISPILWTKVKRGISAGRVQSVALQMIVDREYEIVAFDQEEFWTFNAELESDSPPPFPTKMIKWDGENLRIGNKVAKRSILNQEEADQIEAVLKTSEFKVSEIKTKAKKQNPSSPFTTSKLQQEASRNLGFTVSNTMRTAQRLYEGIEIGGDPVGLITYMRTDSTRISDEALNQVRQFIEETYGSPYLSDKPRVFKQRKNVQDGHEAIRPTNVTNTPDKVAPFLKPHELKLYTMIWRKFVASQMAPKKMDETLIHVQAGPGLFEARGVVTTFPGFSKIYKVTGENTATVELPAVTQGDKLEVKDLTKTQNFTKPPARYSEASLVKALEENGIGRPSTYAAIIATIQNRTYVEKRDTRFVPTSLGFVVSAMLKGSFPELIDVHYTARMEGRLDQVEQGLLTWRELLKLFYDQFQEFLQKAELEMPDMKRQGLMTDISCDACGGKTVLKNGKYGQFLSCANYPDCTGARRIKDIKPEETELPILKGMIELLKEDVQPTDLICPECEGRLVKRRGRYGVFIACSNYPNCRYVHQETTGVACPKDQCDGEVLIKKSKRGRVFYGCNRYPKCDFVSWNRPLKSSCPRCSAHPLFLKERKKGNLVICQQPECSYVQAEDEATVSS